MSNWVSVLGELHPALEIVQLPLTPEDLSAGKNPIYRGPDRSALAYMVENGHCEEDPNGEIFYFGEDELYKNKRYKIVSYPGTDALLDDDRTEKVRTQGYANVEEFLQKRRGVTREQLEKAQLKKLEDPTKHQNPTPKKGRSVYEGLKDVAGPGPFKEGGFGERPV